MAELGERGSASGGLQGPEPRHEDRPAPTRFAEQLLWVSDVALSHLELHELLDELLQRVRQLLSVDTAAVLLTDESDQAVVATAAKGLEEAVERGVRVPLGRGFAGRVAAERRPVVLEDVTPADVVNPVLIEKRVRSLLGVPLLTRGKVTGVLHVGTLSPRRFSQDEVTLLELVADRAARAIDNASLYEREHRIAETLQRSLLPRQLPTLPDMAVGARYVPGGEGMNVGGDWYDVIPLTPGVFAVAIGDVVGRGVWAASTMGHLRTGVRAYALEGHSPARVVQLLDRLVQQSEPGAVATFLYAVVDLPAWTLTYANAGHLAPLLVDGGGARFVQPGGSVPLGVVADGGFGESTVGLEPGFSLVLYTDGLVEDRAGSIDEGLGRLKDVVGRLGEVGIDGYCDSVVAAMKRNGAAADDVALVAVRHVPAQGNRFSRRIEAEAAVLSSLRREVSAWVQALGAGRHEAYELTVSMTEACANAIEHAYGPEDAFIDVEAEVEGDDVVLSVRDFGRWRPQRGRDRGRGLALIHALMDEVQVASGEDGTEVRMRRKLSLSEEP